MNKIEAIIFDLDGTLYSFDEKSENTFSASAFGQQIYANCIAFLQERLELNESEATQRYKEFSNKYHREVSLALECEYEIPRSEYFAATWSLEPKNYLTFRSQLPLVLAKLDVRKGVLTAAPRVWATPALQFLEIQDFFGEAVFTGDPDTRKPQPAAFLQLAQYWDLPPENILAIGDQEWSDIAPAKSVGMQTLRIGKNTQTQADYLASDVLSALALLQAEGRL